MNNANTEQAIYHLVKLLVGEWSDELGFDTSQLEKQHPLTFVSWVRANWKAKVVDNWDVLHPAIGANDDTLQMAHDLLHSDKAVWNVFQIWWPMLRLAARPPLKHRIRKVSVIVSVEYADGREVTVQHDAPMGDSPSAKTDAAFVTLLSRLIDKIVDGLSTAGMDSMYDRFAARKSPSGEPVANQTWDPDKPI